MFYLKNVETGNIPVEDIINSFKNGNYPEILCWYTNDNSITLVAEKPFMFSNVLKRIEELNNREIDEQLIEKHYGNAVRLVLCDNCVCNSCKYKTRQCCFNCLLNNFNEKKNTLCKDAVDKLFSDIKKRREENNDFRLNTDLDTYKEEIVRNNIATQDELRIAIALNGLNLNTLNSIIKLNSDSNDLEQWRLKHGNKISRIRS